MQKLICDLIEFKDASTRINYEFLANPVTALELIKTEETEWNEIFVQHHHLYDSLASENKMMQDEINDLRDRIEHLHGKINRLESANDVDYQPKRKQLCPVDG